MASKQNKSRYRVYVKGFRNVWLRFGFDLRVEREDESAS